MRLLLAAACAALLASPALAVPVELKAQPVDDDGRVTLGELFDGAGAAAPVVVGTRVGPTAVLDAGRLQVLARRAGLDWINATGLRRIVVRQADGASVPAAQSIAQAAAPGQVRGAAVIRKDEAVSVAFARGGVSLTLQGKALESAAVGQSFSVLNPASKKVIEAVAAGPGRAVTGPEAERLKAQAFASR